MSFPNHEVWAAGAASKFAAPMTEGAKAPSRNWNPAKNPRPEKTGLDLPMIGG
jgi:hypothetical protein